MVKHNNILPNVHLRKHWQRWVKTFFDQPGRKRRRLDARRAKAAQIFPRPLQALRPVVSSCTTRYAGKPRIGRGFTLDELQKAGISPRFARTIGVSVDHRRKSRTLEAFQRNVARLRAYREKLVLIPRRADQPKKAAKNTTVADTVGAKADTQTQTRTNDVLPVQPVAVREKAVKITAPMKEFNPKGTLRLEWVNKKWKGKREKKAKEAAAANPEDK